MIESAILGALLGSGTKIIKGWIENKAAHKNQVLDYKLAQLEAKEAGLARAHELQLTKNSAQALAVKADIEARLKLRDTDTTALVAAITAEKSGGGGVYIDALRASVRPVITYSLTLYVMVYLEAKDPAVVLDVWGMAVGFYFGGRVRS